VADSDRFETAVLAVEAMAPNERGGEDALRYLRDAGMSIIQSMRVMMRVRGYSLAEAKRIVHSSDTWADQRAAHEEVHEQLAHALEPPGEEREKS
jgi:hypothetical protein